MTDTLLHASGVRVRAADAVFALDADLSLASGDTMAFLGPNGAGKSTLLRALAGLAEEVEGTIRRDGEVVFLPQQPMLFSGTVLRNVALPLRLRSTPRLQAHRRAVEALTAFGVGHLGPRDARTLSGGEARRVILARTLVTDPDVLLLDEPFDGLDAAARRTLLAEVGGRLPELLRTGDRPRAVVLVTHDPEEVMTLADRVVVLVDGRVHQSGSVEEVFTKPASERVAALVGAENVLFGVVASRTEDLLDVRIGLLEIVVVGEAEVGDEVVLIVRPESIVVYPEAAPESSARNRLPGTIRSLERRPHHVRVVVDVGGIELVAAVAPVSAEELGLAVGRTVTLAAKATAIHAGPRPSRPSSEA